MEVSSPNSARDLAADILAICLYVFKQSGPAHYQLLDSLDLTITQVKTLQVLDGADREASVKDLAALVGTSLPATSRNVETLLQRGFLTRREDELDRRVKKVCLTALGADTSSRLNSTRLAGMEAVTQSLTEQQRTRLRSALTCLTARADVEACRPTESRTP